MSRRRVDPEPVLPPVSMRARPAEEIIAGQQAEIRSIDVLQGGAPADADGFPALSETRGSYATSGTGVSGDLLPRLEVRVVRIVASPRPVRGAASSNRNGQDGRKA